ncbi:hypothetical protein DAPPUDRAFT_241887 [Daphnia pulex]|uniref:Uncharacterized protein n=1 Tax=Daphnia pulex TaxID=6669 RepID=E9GFA8_DAPPU|nr:hypothetical protein DAPPUDRAFT_241887 [Daphnia pulex]|eukprot:EFX81842.1 hypothetical protein DAPPUDRAFT_241887 [Daphnia pulex]
MQQRQLCKKYMRMILPPSPSRVSAVYCSTTNQVPGLSDGRRNSVTLENNEMRRIELQGVSRKIE